MNKKPNIIIAIILLIMALFYLFIEKVAEYSTSVNEMILLIITTSFIFLFFTVLIIKYLNLDYDINKTNSILIKEDTSIEAFCYQYSEMIRRRITNAIIAQNSKANLNLAIGIVTALSGIIYIIFYFPIFNEKDINLYYFLISLLPRLSTLILIETFSYFFLRMYKHNLNEIKHLHNEATEVEYRLLSLNMTIKSDNKELIKDILLFFSKINKNKNEEELVNDIPLSPDYLVKIIKELK